MTAHDLPAGPLHGADDVLDPLLAASAEPGLYLTAPSFVRLDQPAAVSVVLAAAGGARDVERLAIEERAVLVAVEDETGFVRVDRVRRPEPGESDALCPPPGYDGGGPVDVDAVAARMARFDLSTRLGMPWPPGGYAVWAIAADRISKPSLLRVGSSPATHDPALPRYLRDEQKKRDLPAVFPPVQADRGLPHYTRTAESPALPLGEGLAITATRATVAREGAGCVVHGAFRLRAPDERVTPEGAIASITLVITGSEEPGPVAVGLHVPSHDVASPVTGYFAVDLFHLTDIAKRPQTYFVYAFSGRAVAGPAVVAVFSEAQVARGI